MAVRRCRGEGKVGLLFGATGVLDLHYSVIGAMGDRFLLSRLAPAAKESRPRAETSRRGDKADAH